MDNAKRAQQRLVDRGFALTVDGDFGGDSFAALMSWIGNRPLAPLRTKLGKAAAALFPGSAITTPLRIAHALAQQSVETGGFARMVESLNYSPDGLLATFNRSRISAADCARLGRKPGETVVPLDRQELIANLIYGGAFGKSQLGNTKPGDGWKFRGRGAKQLTGRDNYTRIGADMQLDLVGNPALLEDPATGMKAGCLFWKRAKCNSFADVDDITGLTKAINGGDNGLADRKAALERAKAILL